MIDEASSRALAFDCFSHSAQPLSRVRREGGGDAEVRIAIMPSCRQFAAGEQHVGADL